MSEKRFRIWCKKGVIPKKRGNISVAFEVLLRKDVISLFAPFVNIVLYYNLNCLVFTHYFNFMTVERHSFL
jgi:hypothetical protein